MPKKCNDDIEDYIWFFLFQFPYLACGEKKQESSWEYFDH